MRRSRWTALVALVLTLSACAGQPAASGAPQSAGQSPGPTIVSVPSSAPSSAAEETLPPIPADQTEVTFLGSGGQYQDAVEGDIIPAFEKAYPGVKVTHVLGGSLQNLATLTAEAANPKSDVVLLNTLADITAKQRNLLAPLDPALIPNLKHIYPAFVLPDGIGVVHVYQVIGETYNTKVFKEKGWDPPTSWTDLADPKYRGHVYGTECSYTYTLYMIMALADGFGTGQDDTAAAMKMLAEIAPNVQSLVPQPAAMDVLFAQDDAWISWNSSSQTYNLKKSGAPVDFVYPKEGGALQLPTLDVVKGAPNPVAAQAFVNFMLSDLAQQALAKASLLAPARPDTFKNLDSELQALVTGPEIMQSDKVVLTDTKFLNDNLDSIVKECNSVMARP